MIVYIVHTTDRVQNMADTMSVTGIILAGGKSTRLGANKPQLKNGKSHLIDRVIDTLSQFTPSILIVINEDQPYPVKSTTPGARVVKDIYTGKGPLGGIYTGLIHAETGYSLVVGDTPFLNSGLVRYLINGTPGYDATAPKIGWMIPCTQCIQRAACHQLRR